jgi:hypothetical protein
MFKGKISARVNRFGQETTEHVRPVTREDRKILRINGIFDGTNALREIVDDKSEKVIVEQLNVHPDALR